MFEKYRVVKLSDGNYMTQKRDFLLPFAWYDASFPRKTLEEAKRVIANDKPITITEVVYKE